MVQLNAHDEFKIFFCIFNLQVGKQTGPAVACSVLEQLWGTKCRRWGRLKLHPLRSWFFPVCCILPLPCPHPRASLVPCSHLSMVLSSFALVRIPPKPKGSFPTAVYLSICHLQRNIFKEGFPATANSHSTSCCFSAFSLLPITINKFRQSKSILISWKRAVDTQGRMGWYLHWW